MNTLSNFEKIALEEALDDEYKSWSTYDQVIKDFGEVKPFINIRDAESRHIEALLGLFHKYEIYPPENRWMGKTPKFSTLKEACNASVIGEIENVARYDKLFSSTSKQDIVQVFTALRTASQERHLPAFQRCANRNN